MKRAFTLIEILVVCAIIAVLAAIVIVNLEKAQAKSRDAKRKADISQIASALEMYKADNKVYVVHSPTAGESLDFTKLPISSYITAIPVDPIDAPGQRYVYRSDATGTGYKIKAKSETITTLPANCGTAAAITDAKIKAGDFYNPISPFITNDCRYFQVSSSEYALLNLL